MSISEQVEELRKLANSKEFEPHEPVTYGFYARIKSKLFKAADTIESLSAKLADMERSAEDCGGGWIYCDEWLPSTVEYMELEPTPHMKRLEIAYMTDTVEYLIGYYDGSKWMDKHHNIIKNVIAWRKFLPLPDKRHES